MATMIYILFLYNIMPIFGAYYNKKQNAVIINKINTNETEEISDIFK